MYNLFFNKCGIGPDKHIHQELRLFIVEPKNWPANEKQNHIFADDARVDFFSLLHCSYKYEELNYTVILW